MQRVSWAPRVRASGLREWRERLPEVGRPCGRVGQPRRKLRHCVGVSMQGQSEVWGWYEGQDDKSTTTAWDTGRTPELWH